MVLFENIKSFVYHFILLMALLIILPPYYIYKFLSSLITSLAIENVAGKVILITGASSGIGEQLAYEYAKRKAKLVLVARREKLLEKVAQQAKELGSPDVLITSADVSNLDDCKRFVEETIKHFGQLDHLVNNAGIAHVSFFEESTNISKLTSIMEVNFWGSVYSTQFAIPHLKKRKGKIIVIASVAGWFNAPTTSIYGASKAALINFYETLRIELRSQITITIATPAYTDSEMTRGKLISVDGEVHVDQARVDVLTGSFPIKGSAEAAKVIVNGVCRGKKYITDPSWMRMLFLYKAFVPDIIDWYLHSVHGSSDTGTKKLK